MVKNTISSKKVKKMVFGDILRNLIEEKSITQKELGNQLNIAPSTIGNYVRNLREPDYQTLKQIAAYFNVSTDYLLDYHSNQVTTSDHKEDELLRIFRSLDDKQKNFYLAQGKLFLSQTYNESKDNSEDA